jgi:hypothetical protein
MKSQVDPRTLKATLLIRLVLLKRIYSKNSFIFDGKRDILNWDDMKKLLTSLSVSF